MQMSPWWARYSELKELWNVVRERIYNNWQYKVTGRICVPENEKVFELVKIEWRNEIDSFRYYRTLMPYIYLKG